mmetsp:Transcript_25431/g.22593  ORF Transcript_25431/g.22593 Transcript_25431/m.22593 type:complete len:231 (+) Transcript_25431:164-856(+)
MRYISFAYTKNITIGEELGLINSNDGVALFYKRQMLNSTEPRFIEKLIPSNKVFDFVRKNYILTVDIYDKYNSLWYDTEHQFITMISFENFNFTRDDANIAYYRTEVEKLNEKLHLYSHLAIVSEEDWKFIPNLLDTSKSIELVASKNNKWYKSLHPVVTPQNTFDPQVFEEFVYDVYYDRISPFVKSEATPQKNMTNGILTLVGSNMDKFVTQPGHESIVMLYVNWNPH